LLDLLILEILLSLL
jgi:hypothetical protein